MNTKSIILILCFILFSISFATAGPKKTIFKSLSKSELNQIEKLQDGYYVSVKFVNTKKRTYSTVEAFDIAPIYGEFEVHHENGKVRFFGGNFHEGLIEFKINNKGQTEGELCFDRFCINKLKAINKNSFSILVNGKTQKFISVKGFKEIIED